MESEMQESVTNAIQNAIAEGTDEEDIKEIIMDELLRKFGGTWNVTVVPKTDFTGGSMFGKTHLTVKIGKYAVTVLRF
jgi:hypothetical protein